MMAGGGSGMTDWCDFGDLPADQCACGRCRPDVAPAMNTAGWAPSDVVAHTNARMPGKLACGHYVDEHARIAKTDDGWICPDCDPTDGGTPPTRYRGPSQT